MSELQAWDCESNRQQTFRGEKRSISLTSPASAGMSVRVNDAYSWTEGFRRSGLCRR